MLTPGVVKDEERPGGALAHVDDGADDMGVKLVDMSCQPGARPVPPDAVDRGAQEPHTGPGLCQRVESLQYCVLQLVAQWEDELPAAVF